MKRASPKPPIEVRCDVCGKSTLKKTCQSRRNKHNYCSRACFDEGRKNRTALICAKCDKHFERANGFLVDSERRGNKRVFCSNICYRKARKGEPTWSKGKILGPNLKIRGKNHPNWQGGKDQYRENPLYWRIRFHKKNLQWRVTILKRDEFQCARCTNEGRKLHVHHIIPFADLFEAFLERHDPKRGLTEQLDEFGKFWDTANGLTLCTLCHAKIEKKEH